jgi:hypothetical protein
VVHGARLSKALLRRLTELFAGLLARLRTPTFFALGAYAVLVVICTWPVVASLDRYVAGKQGDLRIALWDLWWLETAIREGRSPLRTPYLFYPEGVSLAYHSISWTFAAFALPLRAVFGSIAGYNLAFLLQTFLCATTTFLLARYLVKQGLAAWLAGAIVAFEPYRMTRAMNHPNLASTAFIPLVILFTLRAWRERNARFAWFGGFSLALVLLSGAHLFIMTTLALAVMFVIESLRGRAFVEAKFWKTNAALLAACVLFTGPIVWGYAGSGEEIDEAIQSVDRRGSTDLESLFVINPSQTLLGELVASEYRFYGESGSVSYLGYVTLLLALAAFALSRHRRDAWPFLVVFLVLLGLALGPSLEVGGQNTGLVLPHAWLDNVRAIQAVRKPERFNLVARVFLALLAAFGFSSLVARLGRHARVAWLVVPLLLLDYLAVPHPRIALRQPKFVRELAQLPGTGAILELPLTRQDAKRAMLSQTVHHRPLVGGMVARTPAAAMRYIRRSRLLRSLQGERPDRLDCRHVPLRRELERLRRDGVEYVVYRYSASNRAQRRAYEDVLVGDPVYRDDDVEVYTLRGLLQRDELPCDRAEKAR